MFYNKTASRFANTYNFTLRQQSITRLHHTPRSNTTSRYYVSKIYLCKHNSWVFIYAYVYGMSNTRGSEKNSSRKKLFFNKLYLYQFYLHTKWRLTSTDPNNISKKSVSINQCHLSIEYANLSLPSFKKTLYGFGCTHVSFFAKKFEKHTSHMYDNFKKNYKFLNRNVAARFPAPVVVHKKHTLNVYLLDMIQSYKGTRHARGLPCRGQRT